MPVYEYECEKCGEKFDLRQKFADKPIETHDKCGGGHVHRLLSVPALQFKGSGFYVNDYAKSGSSPAASGSSKSESGASKAESGDSKASSSTAAPAEKSSSSSSESKGSSSDTKKPSQSDTK